MLFVELRTPRGFLSLLVIAVASIKTTAALSPEHSHKTKTSFVIILLINLWSTLI